MVIQTKGHKYGYQGTEVFLMVLITAITNFAIIPTIVMFHKQKMFYQFFIANFTLIASFMYHLLDSLSTDVYFLTVSEWHRIDNVGSIACF